MRGASRSQYVNIGKRRDDADARFGRNPKGGQPARRLAVAAFRRGAMHATQRKRCVRGRISSSGLLAISKYCCGVSS
jgi:hypothetical protein